MLFGLASGIGAEESFLSALNVHNLLGALVRPYPLLLAVIVLALAVLAYRLRKSGAPSGETGLTGFQPKALLLWRNVVPALGIAVGAAFSWGSLEFGAVESWFMPRVAGLAVMAFCLLDLLFSTRNQEQSRARAGDTATET